MRLLFVFIFSLLTSSLLAQIMIDGIVPFHDSESRRYLLSIQESLWGKDYHGHIDSEYGTAEEITINRETVQDNTFIFHNINADSRFNITVGNSMPNELSFTYLPIIHIEGDFGYEYCNATVTLQSSGQYPVVMKALIKWRGGATNVPGKNKRNYKIKFIDENGEKKDYRFFGLRKDNIWILDAGQIDLSRIRNRAAADLWNDFVRKPYYIQEEPEALTASRGELVELFVNNCYQGVFNMCEPIDRKQMQLMKFNNYDGTIHGGLWKAAGWGYATFWDIPEEYDNAKENWDVFEVKYPEIDDLCPTDYSTLYNAIKFVSSSTDKEFIANVDEYFDIPVLIDYYIFCNVLNAFDNTGKNIYWAVYDKKENKMLTPAIWDLDCTVGQNYTNNPQRPNYVKPDNGILFPTRIISRLVQLDVNEFNKNVTERYTSLRQGVLSTESFIDRYKGLIYRLIESGAAQREEERWSMDSDISGLKLDLKSELDYISEWITARSIYLDKHWKETTNIIDLPDVDSSVKIINIYGQEVDENYKGVVIKNGCKIIQK